MNIESIIEEEFLKARQVQKTLKAVEEEYYKKSHKLEEEYKSLISKMTSLKLESLDFQIGDKVKDSTYDNCAFFMGVSIRQKPISYLKKAEEIVFSDFEFISELKMIKTDGTIGKKEPLGIFKLENLKKI